MLGRPMVLAGSDAKQVQWTNVYQDALVRLQDPAGWICSNRGMHQNIGKTIHELYDLGLLSLHSVGSWDGCNRDSACI